MYQTCKMCIKIWPIIESCYWFNIWAAEGLRNTLWAPNRIASVRSCRMPGNLSSADFTTGWNGRNRESVHSAMKFNISLKCDIYCHLMSIHIFSSKLKYSTESDLVSYVQVESRDANFIPVRFYSFKSVMIMRGRVWFNLLVLSNVHCSDSYSFSS